MCSATGRILVQEGIAAEFTRRLVAAAAALKQGGPFVAGVDIGPSANRMQYDKVRMRAMPCMMRLERRVPRCKPQPQRCSIHRYHSSLLRMLRSAISSRSPRPRAASCCWAAAPPSHPLLLRVRRGFGSPLPYSVSSRQRRSSRRRSLALSRASRRSPRYRRRSTSPTPPSTGSAPQS